MSNRRGFLGENVRALAILSPLAEEMREAQTFIDQNPEALHAWLICRALLLEQRSKELLVEAEQAIRTAMAESDPQAMIAATELYASRERANMSILRYLQGCNAQRMTFMAAMAKAEAKRPQTDEANELQGLRRRAKLSKVEGATA